ncbi:MAG: hypothetical protein ABR600_05805 [Actinomycetota bacterium]
MDIALPNTQDAVLLTDTRLRTTSCEEASFVQRAITIWVFTGQDDPRSYLAALDRRSRSDSGYERLSIGWRRVAGHRARMLISKGENPSGQQISAMAVAFVADGRLVVIFAEMQAIGFHTQRAMVMRAFQSFRVTAPG